MSAQTAAVLSRKHPQYLWTGKLRKVLGVCFGLLISAVQPPKAKNNNKTLKIADFNRRETVATHLQQITGKIHLERTFKANVTK